MRQAKSKAKSARAKPSKTSKKRKVIRADSERLEKATDSSRYPVSDHSAVNPQFRQASVEDVYRPPGKALELVDLLCDPNMADVLIGDLTEGFHKRVLRNGANAANRWVWAQALRSVVPIAWAASKRVAGLGAAWKAAEVALHFVRAHMQ